MSSAELVDEVDKRVQRRRRTLGEVKPSFPSFGVISSMPEFTGSNAALAHHLRRANEMGPPPLNLKLAPSPATRIPLLGRMWQLVRGQLHELILFYVNRTASHEAQLDGHIVSTLNELTRVIEQQQKEIERLQAELETVKEER
jgi:uncharacterized small protein (DUF1192 family)